MTLKLLSVSVILHEGRLMFLREKDTVPKHQLKSLVTNYLETDEGYLTRELYVSEFGSMNPTTLREVDSACVLYRNGELSSQSRVDYFSGQSDGYHVMVAFKETKPDTGHATSIRAEVFEEGDIIAFLVQK